MRISLIEARPAHCNAFEKFAIPRLGLPIMGAMLRAEGHDVRVYVHQLDGLWQHSLDIAKSDLIGISTITQSNEPAAPSGWAVGWASVSLSSLPHPAVTTRAATRSALTLARHCTPVTPTPRHPTRILHAGRPHTFVVPPPQQGRREAEDPNRG